MSGAPYTKAQQLGHGRKRKYRRFVAGPKQWEILWRVKFGPCLICGSVENGRVDTKIDLHHVVPRSAPWFGEDVADNLVPLCRGCHDVLERRGEVWTGRGRRGEEPRKRPAAAEMIVKLSDAEYAYAVQRGGEAFFERCYGIRYSR